MSSSGPIEDPINLGGGNGWISDLKPLATAAGGGVVGTLVTIASDPEQWLATVINKWVVGGVLEAGAFVLGWIVFAYERTASIIGDVAGPLASPFRIIEDAVVGAIDLVYGVAIGVAHSAGLAGPPAAAFAVALVSVVLAAVAFAVWRAFPVTEALGGGLEAIR